MKNPTQKFGKTNKSSREEAKFGEKMKVVLSVAVDLQLFDISFPFFWLLVVILVTLLGKKEERES